MVLRTAAVLFMLFIATSAKTQTRPVKELAPGVFYYFGDELRQMSANCVWIIFEDYVLAIDANYPWGAEEIIAEIKKTSGKPVKFLFDTHYHHDHTFGNGVFVDAGAVIVSTIETAREMHTLGQHEWDNGSAYSGRSMKGYRREFPSLTFRQQLIFDDGTHRVELRKMLIERGGQGLQGSDLERCSLGCQPLGRRACGALGKKDSVRRCCRRLV